MTHQNDTHQKYFSLTGGEILFLLLLSFISGIVFSVLFKKIRLGLNKKNKSMSNLRINRNSNTSTNSQSRTQQTTSVGAQIFLCNEKYLSNQIPVPSGPTLDCTKEILDILKDLLKDFAITDQSEVLNKECNIQKIQKFTNTVGLKGYFKDMLNTITHFGIKRIPEPSNWIQYELYFVVKQRFRT